MRLSLALFLSLAVACTSSRSVRIDATIDPSLSMEGQWAYLGVMWGNQADLLDSCIIRDHTIRLRGKLPYDEMFAQVFTRDATYQFFLTEGEHVSLHIDSLTDGWAPEACGSYATEELRRNHLRIRALAEQTRPFAEAADTLSFGSAEYLAMQDSIARIRKRIPEQYARMLRSRSVLCAVYGCLAIFQEIPQDSLRRIVSDLKKRFPQSVYLPTIAALVEPEPVDPATPRSVWAANRMAQIKGHAMPYPDRKTPAPEKRHEDEPSVAAYVVGDRVEPFALPGQSGVKIGLETIATPYVLLDFWASWCGPCRREVPVLKQTAEQYRNFLTVVAVSLDRDAAAWTKAIGEDRSERFVHLLLARDEPQFGNLVQRFSIRTIPTNFLLDRQHRIVAVDLHGEALAAKMKELAAR